ncbi:MAG: sulfatase [Myxococcota bacterium]|nr:sulfatase [Myxococcota bacterium]
MRTHVRTSCVPFFAAPLCALAIAACSPAPPPNFLLVTIDTLRPDHTSAYGYVRDTTPTLREFATRATRFDAAYAPQGMTAPSHATLFTGLHPLGHRLVDNGQRFEPHLPVLAERLHSAGYTTAAFVSSYPLKKRFGFARGFDLFDDQFEASDGTVEVDRWHNQDIDGAFDRNAAASVDRAIAWLRKPARDETPFFLWLHLFEPHSPLTPDPSVRDIFNGQPLPSHYDAAFAPYADLYDAEILFADRQLGRLLAEFENSKRANSTLMVVTADHGEGLNQHGWWLHGVSVHESEIRVPLLIRLPGQTSGRVVATPTQLADVLPSLGEWLPLGLEDDPIEPASTSGSSLAALLREQPTRSTNAARDLHFFRRHHAPRTIDPTFPIRTNGEPSAPKHITGEEFGLRRGDWKLIYAPEQREAALYNLATDPRELRNIADEHKELTRELIAAATRFADRHDHQNARERSDLEAEERAALEALGYVE